MSEREMETKHDICLSCKLPNEAYFTVVKLDAGQIVGRSLSTNCSTKTQIQEKSIFGHYISMPSREPKK